MGIGSGGFWAEVDLGMLWSSVDWKSWIWESFGVWWIGNRGFEIGGFGRGVLRNLTIIFD